MNKIIIGLVLLAGMWQGAAAGELTLGWNRHLDSSWVNDIEFMPDKQNFLLANNYAIELRDVGTSEIIQSYPYRTVDMEFTPDSTRLLCAIERKLQLRNLNDMSLIKEYIFPINPNDSVPVYINKIMIDPKKPLAYILWSKKGAPFGVQPWVDSSNIFVFNYESMQPVTEFGLTDKVKFIHYADISKDGKYLTAINEGATQLMVWSLDSLKFIRNFELVYNSKFNKSWGVPTCIKFSQLNSNNIYFSGTFPEFKDDTRRCGLFTYSISENKIIDSTFGVGPNNIPQGDEGYFSFFDNNRKIIINSSGINLFILNNTNKNIENTYINYNTTFALGTKAIIKNNTFVGIARQNFAMFKYDSLNDIVNLSDSNNTVYPNPTNDYITISVGANGCSPESIKIFDVFGQEEHSPTPSYEEGELRVDVSALTPGVYFVRVVDKVQKFIKY